MSRTRLREYRLGPPYGGVNKQFATHVLPDNVATVTDNFVLRSKGLQTVKGWEKFTAQVLTDGTTSQVPLVTFDIKQFNRSDGSSYILAFTNKGVWWYDAVNTDIWQPINPGEKSETSVDSDSTSGTTTLNVADTTGYSVGDGIVIGEGTVREEFATIASISVGVSFTLVANLTYTHTAVQADPVRRTYDVSYVDATSAAGQAVLSVYNTTNFTVGESVIIGLGTARAEIGVIDSISAGVSITLEDNLTYEHTLAQADKVYNLKDLLFSSSVSQFDFAESNDVFYFTDFINPVSRISTISDPLFHEPLPGLQAGDDVQGIGTLTVPLKAKYIAAFESFIVLGHLEEEGNAAPNKIRWSQISDGETWENEPDGTGQSGFFAFNTADSLTGLKQLKRELMVYRENRVEAQSYVGLPDIFAFRNVLTDTGLVSPKAFEDFGDYHAILAKDNIYQINGISKSPLAGKIRDELFSEINPSQITNVYFYNLKEFNELRVCYSTTTGRVHDKAFTFNTQIGEWAGPVVMDATGYGFYRRQLDQSWDSMVDTWDSIPNVAWDDKLFASNSPLYLVGNDDGLIFSLDGVSEADGVTISKRYESKMLDLGSGAIIKTVQKIRLGLDVSGSPEVNVYLGVAFSENDTVTWKGPYALEATAGYEPYVYMDEWGRYFKVRVDTDDSTTIEDVTLHWYPRAEI